MTTPDVRATATQLRQMLMTAYAMRGREFGLGLARRCAWEIGDVVAEIHGRETAGAVLDEVSNAVLGDALPGPLPAADIVVPDGHMLMTVPRTIEEADALLSWVESLRDSVERVSTPQISAPVVTRKWWQRLGGLAGRK